ncbi:hypothetical protein ACFWBB_23330 [Streptomyces sp. NPDC060000]|uniref:hypothetical protein n=1 Tax=Streptomyces sp. NPDC060000 TaxID=3347031 RepID=UPI0036BA9E1B
MSAPVGPPPPEDSVPRVIPIAKPVPMTLLPARTWTHEQWTRIQQGFMGRDMEDKWDILIDGRIAVVRRSWTGHIFYEATFEPVDGGWWIASAVTGADDRRSRSPGDAYAIDEENGVMLEWMISGILLGEADEDLQYRLQTVLDQSDRSGEALPRLTLHTALGLRTVL